MAGDRRHADYDASMSLGISDVGSGEIGSGEIGSSERVALHSAPDTALRAAHASALVLALALIALGLAWELWLVPIGRGTLALKVLPLVAALPGLVQHRLYTYRWLSLALWLYVLEGLVRSTSGSGPAVPLAALEVVLAVALFVLCVICISRRSNEGAKAA